MALRALAVWTTVLTAVLAGLALVAVLVDAASVGVVTFLGVAVMLLAGREAFARYCPRTDDRPAVDV